MDQQSATILTEDERAEIEQRLTDSDRWVFGSIFVDKAAKITVEVKLPDGVGDEGTHAVADAVGKAMERLAAVVSPVLPAKQEAGT